MDMNKDFLYYHNLGWDIWDMFDAICTLNGEDSDDVQVSLIANNKRLVNLPELLITQYIIGYLKDHPDVELDKPINE
jgi:hypothetical protein